LGYRVSRRKYPVLTIYNTESDRYFHIADILIQQVSKGVGVKKGVSWIQFGKDILSKKFAEDLYSEISKDNVFNGAAALAYYWMLALFPATIFLLTLLPYLPIPDLDKAILDLMHQAMPRETANLVEETVDTVINQKHGGLFSFGIIFTIWTASTGIYAIMQQLNITYNVEEGRSFPKARGIALLLTFIVLILIISAFGLVVFGGIIQDWLASVFGSSDLLLSFFSMLRWIIIICFLLLGFAVLFYFGPNVEQRFKFITPGSLLGVVVFVFATLGFRYYVANFGNYNATYGSIGAVIVLMLWLYITGLVFLVGSEVNVVLEDYHPEGKERGVGEGRRNRASTSDFRNTGTGR
jgi:membrane protein